MEELSFLHRHVPLRVSKRIAKTTNQINGIAKEVMLRSRETTIFFASFQNIKEEIYKNAINEMLCIQNNPIDSFSLFSATQIQTFSFLLEYLHKNITLFAEKMQHISEQPYFEYVSLVSFPALFGYFSNEEMCFKAADFYIKSAESITLESFSVLSASFFASQSVWPFSCAVFDRFLLDKDENIQNLFVLCSESIKYLPEHHLTVLRHVKEKWGLQKLWEFLSNVLILPQFKIHVAFSPFAKRYEKIRADKILNDKLKEGVDVELTLSESVVSAMSTHNQEDKNFSQKTVITAFDVRVLLSLPVMFPGYLQCITFIDKRRQFVPFSVEVFIKKNVEFKEVPLIFNKKQIKSNQSTDLICKWNKIRKELDDPVGFLLTFNGESQNELIKSAFDGEKGKELLNISVESEIERYNEKISLFEKMLTNRVVLDSFFLWNDRSLEYSNFISLFYAKNNETSTEFGNSTFWCNVLEISSKEKLLCKPKRIIKQEKRFAGLLRLLKRKYENMFDNEKEAIKNHIMKISAILKNVDEKSSVLERFIVITMLVEMTEELSEVFPCDERRSDNISRIIHYFIIVNEVKWIYRTASLLQKYIFGAMKFAIPFPISEKWNYFFTAFLNLISSNERVLTDFTLTFS